MVYRVLANMTFESEETASELFEHIKNFWNLTTDENNGYENDSKIGALELCGHDQHPPAPCSYLRTLPETE